jgi:SAM-dependent methyltransferase
MIADSNGTRGNLPLGADTMSPAMASAGNYYAWIASQFQPVLGHNILDIGGGHGAHLDHVVRKGRKVVSVDLSEECVRNMQRKFAGQGFQALCGDITEPDFLSRLKVEAFDTIVCVNVLEHIEHDATALEAMAEILRPAQGRLFLLVPAHPFLYGTPDVLAGHFRRYRRRDLHRLLVASGFRNVRTRYFNSFGALPYLLNSRILRPKTLGGPVDTQIILFDRYLVPTLRRLEAWVRVPFGQSLIAVAEVGDRR